MLQSRSGGVLSNLQIHCNAWLSAVVTLLLVALLFYFVHFGDALTALINVNPVWLLVLAIVHVVSRVSRAIKWN